MMIYGNCVMASLEDLKWNRAVVVDTDAGSTSELFRCDLMRT